MVALTATACKKVSEDTLKVLRITNSAVRFNTGYDRPNLLFEVRLKPPHAQGGDAHNSTIDDMVQYINHGRFPPSSTGIIYCMSRQDCEDTALSLQVSLSLSLRLMFKGLSLSLYCWLRM